jgi:hypothetical protein
VPPGAGVRPADHQASGVTSTGFAKLVVGERVQLGELAAVPQDGVACPVGLVGAPSRPADHLPGGINGMGYAPVGRDETAVRDGVPSQRVPPRRTRSTGDGAAARPA